MLLHVQPYGKLCGAKQSLPVALARLIAASDGLDAVYIADKRLRSIYYSQPSIASTMSTNAFFSSLAVFDGQKYNEWSTQMQSYLMSQGTWAAITVDRPDTSPEEWDSANMKAIGAMRIKLVPSITNTVKAMATAKEVWNHLAEKYGKPGIAAIYANFKEALDIKVPAEGNPLKAFDQFVMHFERLAANAAPVPEYIQAMILMAKLPSVYDPLVTLLNLDSGDPTTTPKITGLTLASIRTLLKSHSEQRQGRRQGAQEANRLSAVKRKGRDPIYWNLITCPMLSMAK